MQTTDHLIDALARVQDNVITRDDVLRCGGTDSLIANRLARGLWQPLQAGVYLAGSAPPTWHQLVRAAVAAAGEEAVVSHRAALLLWGLDGIAGAPPEIVVPFNGDPDPLGVVVHRSRRIEPASIVDGIPVTSVERTLLECAAMLPPVVIEKAFACAWRRNLTSPQKSRLYLEHHGGRGRHGTRLFRDTVTIYEGTLRPPGSGGEVVFLRLLRQAGVDEPVRQYEIALPDGTKATADFAWPELRKLIEFEGLESHSDSRALAYDTLREDDVRAVGWDLRRYPAHTLKVDPKGLAWRAIRFLCGNLHAGRGNTRTER